VDVLLGVFRERKSLLECGLVVLFPCVTKDLSAKDDDLSAIFFVESSGQRYGTVVFNDNSNSFVHGFQNVEGVTFLSAKMRAVLFK
jgi:hypothetical protein